jgi:hypothetical protein
MSTRKVLLSCAGALVAASLFFGETASARGGAARGISASGSPNARGGVTRVTHRHSLHRPRFPGYPYLDDGIFAGRLAGFDPRYDVDGASPAYSDPYATAYRPRCFLVVRRVGSQVRRQHVCQSSAGRGMRESERFRFIVQ